MISAIVTFPASIAPGVWTTKRGIPWYIIPLLGVILGSAIGQAFN
jgi:hypothetical protein